LKIVQFFYEEIVLPLKFVYLHTYQI
jgi:hypothetical protein